jgi:hypothetical protein
MSTRFDPPPTAEQVLSAVDAVFVCQQVASPEFVASFTDMTIDQAESALLLAEDIGFIGDAGGGQYRATSPLCRFVATMNQTQKAAILRLLLESYPPFATFRERLASTGIVADAARETKVLHGLDEHRDNISNSLISLGTYSQALSTTGAGRYEVNDIVSESISQCLMRGCGEEAVAEDQIRKQLGSDAAEKVDRDHVVSPLANALRRAQGHDPRGAVTEAGNAVESYLIDLAHRLNINLAGKNGIHSKVDEIRKVNPRVMPNKLSKVGVYLGTIRNAADHGIDSEIGTQWEIRESTGIEFVVVACSFIAATTRLELGKSPEI